MRSKLTREKYERGGVIREYGTKRGTVLPSRDLTPTK